MNPAFQCEACCWGDPDWRLDRRGDAVVSWACSPHLGRVVEKMQRHFERTEIIVKRAALPEDGTDER